MTTSGTQTTAGPSYGVSISRVLWLYAMLLPSLALGWWALSWERALAGGIFGLVTLCLGHSVGLHRGVIHYAYETSTWFRNLLIFMGVLTGVGGPLAMIRSHHQRDYWQNQPDCPGYFAYDHGLLTDYYLNLHTSHAAPFPFPKEWETQRTDRFLVWMERTWRLYTLALAAVLYVTLGWEWVVVCVCMRVTAGIFGHWSINFITHTRGYMRYIVPGATEEGRNNYVLGWLSFGEGFHNNHHAYPSSARMGHTSSEVDMGWWAIRSFEVLGLVWGVKAHGRDHDGRSSKAHELDHCVHRKREALITQDTAT